MRSDRFSEPVNSWLAVSEEVGERRRGKNLERGEFGVVGLTLVGSEYTLVLKSLSLSRDWIHNHLI